jgi:prepilin-type N-terminal cleavage/methylation domain-containing protein
MTTDPYPLSRFYYDAAQSSLTKNRPGFTLVEVLAASLILAVSTIVICQLCHHCINNHLMIGDYECAYRLADEIFERALARELPLPAHPDTLTGDFAPAHPEYAWSLTIKPAPRKNLYDLAVTVSWTAREKQYQITSATLMYDFLERPAEAAPIAPEPPPVGPPVSPIPQSPLIPPQDPSKPTPTP